jgi:hypothetical protein
MTKTVLSCTRLLLLLLPVAACSCPANGAPDDATTEDAAAMDDARPHVDADGEPDAGEDRPVDVEIEAESDTRDRDEVGGDEVTAEVDTDTAIDADDDGDTSILPTGCTFVWPTTDIGYGWAGLYSIDAGKFVWRWADTSSRPSRSVLMVRDLAVGADREVLRRTYPDMLDVPSIYDDSVFFMSMTEEGVGSSGEIFAVSLIDGPERQLTDNDVADGFPVGGDAYVVYMTGYDLPDGGYVDEYRYADLSDGSEHTLIERSPGAEFAFDGRRWIALQSDGRLYKFDLLRPSEGPQLITERHTGTKGMAFDRDTGTLIIATATGTTEYLMLEAWDVTTNASSLLVDDPWDQYACDVDGHVVVYQDSQAAGERYGEHGYSELRIIDRDTGVKRVVMPLDTYFSVGIWERWIAFNNYGMYGDSLITCDLVAGGYMDEDLHVIPE